MEFKPPGSSPTTDHKPRCNICDDVYLRDGWWDEVSRTGLCTGSGRAAVKRALWTGSTGPAGGHDAGGAGQWARPV